jgi:hypothetical protein
MFIFFTRHWVLLFPHNFYLHTFTNPLLTELLLLKLSIARDASTTKNQRYILAASVKTSLLKSQSTNPRVLHKGYSIVISHRPVGHRRDIELEHLHFFFIRMSIFFLLQCTSVPKLMPIRSSQNHQQLTNHSSTVALEPPSHSASSRTT